LVRHPPTLARLRAEITSTIGTQPNPTRDQIRNMPFLAGILSESLRLYPRVPVNNREAVRTTILPTGGGADGKSPIMVRVRQLTAEKHFGEDADEFRPERWETGELADVGWGYFPFLRGPRQCIGEDFARMEVAYAVVRLVQEFVGIEMPEGEVVEAVGRERQRLTLVLSCEDGCRVRARRAAA
ncbi:cytochrome P450, partial [Podospora conica]